MDLTFDGVLIAGVLASFVLLWFGVNFQTTRKWTYIFKVLPIFVGLAILLYTFTFEAQFLNQQANNVNLFSSLQVIGAGVGSDRIYITYFNSSDGSLWLANDTGNVINYTLIAAGNATLPKATPTLALQQEITVIYFFYLMIAVFIISALIEIILMIRNVARASGGLWRHRKERMKSK